MVGYLVTSDAVKAPTKNPVISPNIIPVETVWKEWQIAKAIGR